MVRKLVPDTQFDQVFNDSSQTFLAGFDVRTHRWAHKFAQGRLRPRFLLTDTTYSLLWSRFLLQIYLAWFEDNVLIIPRQHQCLLLLVNSEEVSNPSHIGFPLRLFWILVSGIILYKNGVFLQPLILLYHMYELRDNSRCLLYRFLKESNHLLAEVPFNKVKVTHLERQALRICDGLDREVAMTERYFLYLVANLFLGNSGQGHLLNILY